MKAIQKIKNQLKNLIRKPLVKCSEESVGVTTRQKEPRPQRRRAAGTPCPKSTLRVAFSDSVSEKHLNGGSSSRKDSIVLRHGLFLSLYSLIKKASSKLPWRSRTNHNSGFSSSSSNYSLSGTRNYIKNFRRIRILGSASLFSLGLLLLATFVPLYNVTRTEDTEAAAGTAKDSSITFTATRSTASVDLAVTSENGTFASSTSSNQAAFSLSTTNFTGYTLTIASNNNTSTLTNNNGGTLSSISSPIDESTFNTTTYNNKWGYKPNYYDSSANSNYLQSPTTTADTLDETSSANSTAKNYTIALGARADYTNASGTYSSSNYKLMYVANPVAYSISFDKGSASEDPSNMPTVVTGSVSALSVNLPNTVPTRTAYDFIGWCLGAITTTNNVDTCSNANVYNPDGNGTNLAFGIDRESDNDGVTLHAMWKIKTYTITRRYRLQDTSGNYPSSYTADGTVTVNYGGSYTYSRSATTSHQAASTSISNVTSARTIYLDVPRKTFTCSRQYRLENVDGSWTSYTSDGSVTAYYGGSCSYSKSVTNYRGSDSAANSTSGSASASNVTSSQTLSISMYRNVFTCTKQYHLQNADGTYPSDYTSAGSESVRYEATCSYSQSYTDYQTKSTSTTITAATTLSLELPRNTYTLTVSAGSNTSSATGSGTYRWGQTVTVGVTKATNVTCITYAAPTWTATAGTAPSAGASVSYTMPKSDATVTASSSASNVAQTVTLSKNTGVSGISIGGTNYTGTSASLNCGTYDISGNYDSNYEFSSWEATNGVAVASTSTASTTMTVSGAGTLTLNAKSSKLYMQNFTASTCSGLTKNTNYTVYDSRDENAYTVSRLADDHCWMTQNLRLGKGDGTAISLSSSDSNLPSGTTFSLKASGMGSNSPSSANGGDCNVGDWYPSSNATYFNVSHLCINTTDTNKYGVYYNWYTATAGTGKYETSPGNATGSICPKGWILPPNEGDRSYYNLLFTKAGLSSNSTSSTTMQNAPYNFPLSGRAYGAGIDNVGTYGIFWSSSAANNSYAYVLYFDSSDVGPRDSSHKGRGYSVRCVFGS